MGGSLKTYASLDIGYDQHQVLLDDSLTVMETICSLCLRHRRAMFWAGWRASASDNVDKRFTCSGGERSVLTSAR